MKVFSHLMKNARQAQDINNVPFTEILPMKLRDFVSGKGVRSNDVGCVQEMTILFACLKTNDFNQSACSKEINTFNGCYKTFLDAKLAQKTQRQKRIVTTGKNLHPRELNVYLRKYPN